MWRKTRIDNTAYWGVKERLIAGAINQGIMMRPIIAALALLFVGCGRDLQGDVRQRLIKPFFPPDQQPQRSAFFEALSQRCALATNLVFISYDIKTSPFVVDDKQFYDSAGLTVHFLAHSPDTGTFYLGREEWYLALDNIHPLLLRRETMIKDKLTGKILTITNMVARRTVFDND